MTRWNEAALKLGVTNHQTRRLIKEGVLAAEQSFRVLLTKSVCAICRTNGSSPRLREKVACVGSISRIKLQCFRVLERGVHNERDLTA
jgi:hypothetical protein